MRGRKFRNTATKGEGAEREGGERGVGAGRVRGLKEMTGARDERKE